MTIEDAIRRAKLLGQARLQQQDAESSAHARALKRRGGSEVAPESPRPVTRAVPAAPLATVEISVPACEENRILLTDAQQREYPAADAAYRLLRSRLQNRLKQNNWFSLAIASPSQDDGKSITSLNLAVSIAREKQKPVYLLDLDMRNPSLCRFLGLRDFKPLPEYLAGRVGPDEVLYETSFANLIVSCASSPVDGASELLAGPRFSELLAHIRARSPDALVLIDLPPVNQTDEALLVGPSIDAFLVVVSEGGTERKQLSQTLSALAEFTVAGIVVNRSSDSHAAEYARYSA